MSLYCCSTSMRHLSAATLHLAWHLKADSNPASRPKGSPARLCCASGLACRPLCIKALLKKATHTSVLQIMSKVEVIPGDLAKPQCGISEENQTRLLPEVQYVIHAAASIQFDNPIHTDLTLSYVASKTIADFAAKVGLLLVHSWSFIGRVTYLCSLHIPGISRHTLLTWQRSSH